MASILRSGKFVRYFSGIARNIVFNSTKETDGNFVHHSQKLCSNLTHGFASAVPKPSDQTLEKSLKRLDQDVRRTGRISRRDLEEVLDEIRLHRSATSSQSLLVIRCCGNLVPEELPEIRTALVQEIWKTLNNLNVSMDVSHYNALLRVYLENEHQFSPTEFLADLQSKGIEPNRVTFQRLISRYCQQGDIEGATRILEFMREKQLPINEHVFNALIMGHSQAEDMESSLGIISVMKQAGLEPTADTYTTLLCSYAKVGDISSINSTLDTCEKNEIYILDKDIFDVIYTLSTNGHSAHVAELLPRLRKSAGYNQDAVNLILRLVNKEQEQIALEVLKTMPRGSRPDGEPTDTGTFFIKQLIKAKRPTENIQKICKELQETGLNSKAFQIAVEAGVTSGSVDLALPFLKELKNMGQPIRQHYFWPLICTQSKSEDTEAVLNILRQMQEDFQLTPSGETIRDYVIPNLKETRSEAIITLLRTSGVSVSTAATSTVYNLLSKNNLREAAAVATSYNVFYQPGLFRRPLVQSFVKTGDVDSFIRFVRQVYDSIPRLEQMRQKSNSTVEDTEVVVDGELVDTADPTQTTEQTEVLGQVILDVITHHRQDRTQIVVKILKALVGQGLSISNTQAEKIQERLGSELTIEISELLGQLAAGDLEPIPLDKSTNRPSGFAQLSVEQLEKMIETQEAKGENTKGLNRFLLSALFKSKDLPKTEATIARLEKDGFVLTAGIYAQLIDMCAINEQEGKALEIFNQIRAKEPDFSIDHFKIIRLTTLLVSKGKTEEALNFMEMNKKSEKDPDAFTFNYNTTCWRLLNELADRGNANDLNRVFDALESYNLVEINNVLLGPLVKVHLVNNEQQKAVDVFEALSTKHRCTPWKNDLACKLIQAEDATNLQRLTDLSTNIHGEVNSLYDLVFSFVECGRIRQARKILETPGLRSRPQKINVACERYQQEGKVESLEGLVEATKDLNHIDRADIYYNLLLSYCKDNQPEKALGLWTKMQEEDIPPTEPFLNKLGNFLKSNNLEVPFVIPESAQKKQNVPQSQPKQTKSVQPKPKAEQPTQKKAQTPTVVTPPQSETVSAFKKSIRSNDIDKAIEAKKQLSPTDKISITDHSVYVESLLNADRLNEATKSVLEILQQKAYPTPRIFRFYLNKLGNAGDVESFIKIHDLINSETKKMISFDNRLCHAYIESGKSEQYLDILDKEISEAKTAEELAALSEKFPRGGSIGILQKHPELADKFELLAEKYAAKQHIGPMNVLWIHHFIAGNAEAAEQIWTKYVSKSPRLMFQRIVQEAREQQNEPLVRKLIDVLKTSEQPITVGGLGVAYSCLIDVQAAKGQFDDGLLSVETALQHMTLEQINRTALLRIRDGLQAAGQTFPHKIPDRAVNQNKSDSFKDDTSSSSSSSSSSSDDEPKPKRP